jgi:intein/homing endonuclease
MTKAELAQLETKLSDRWWRLNNLYYITNEKAEKILYRFNDVQEYLYNNLWYMNLILKSRQHGITTFMCMFFLDVCLFNSNIRAGIIAHNKEDAEAFFSDKIRFAYDNLPEIIKANRPADTSNTRELKFSNNSAIRVGVSMRSATLQFLHISEFGKICRKYPEKADEIVTGSLNTVHAGQFITIESTAEGQDGYFYKYCQESHKKHIERDKLSKLDFRFFFFPWFEDPRNELDIDGVVIPKSLKNYFAEIESKLNLTFSDKKKAWYAKKWETLGEKMWQEHPSCIAGGAIIGTKDGFVPIEDVVPDGKDIIALYEKGEQDTFRVTTKLGYNVTGTADHPILTVGGEFVHIGDLIEGQSIALSIPAMSNDIQTVEYPFTKFATGRIEITENFALFLGLFMGDGSFHKNCVSVVCDSQDQDLVDVVYKLMERYLDKPSVRHCGKTDTKRGWIELRSSNIRYEPHFIALELVRKNNSGSWKRNVCIPSYIMKSPKNVVSAFLRGLFEADGFASREGNCTKMFTKYPEFAQRIQILLLGFGITCRVSKHIKKSGGGHEYVGYEISLRTKETQEFVDKIGFISKRKTDRSLKSRTLKRHGNWLPIKYNDEIVSIDPAGIQPVYDLTTKSKRFSANGIIVHNCPEEAFKARIEGAYFKRQFNRIYREKRIDLFTVEDGIPVRTWWDIGGDNTSIWFTQDVEGSIHLIDFEQGANEGLPYYADILNEKGYKYGRHVLPHDGKVNEWGTGTNRLDQVKKYLGSNVKILKRTKKTGSVSQVEAARNILQYCRFHAENCAEGIKALESYRKEWNDKLGCYRETPLHDWASHPADAFMVMAVCHRFGKQKRQEVTKIEASGYVW